MGCRGDMYGKANFSPRSGKWYHRGLCVDRVLDVEWIQYTLLITMQSEGDSSIHGAIFDRGKVHLNVEPRSKMVVAYPDGPGVLTSTRGSVGAESPNSGARIIQKPLYPV